MLKKVGQRTVTIEKIRPAIRKNRRFQPDLVGLGLGGRLHQRRTLPDNVCTRGMINKVSHLVRVVDYEGDGRPPSAQYSARFSSENFFSNAEASFRLIADTENSENEALTKYNDSSDVGRFFDSRKSGGIAEVNLASAALSAAKGTGDLTVDRSRNMRIDLAMATRKLYNLMFSSDEVKAGHAAYALVSNSRSYGKGLDPNADPNELSDEDADKFRAGVNAMLKKHRVTYVTSLSASRTSVKEGDAVVEVHLRISKSLAFNISGKKVFVGGDKPVHFLMDELFISCPIAKNAPQVKMDQGDGLDVVVDATAEFVMDADKIEETLPVFVAAPNLRESRRVPIE